MKDQIKHIISLRTLLNYNIRKAFIAEMQLRIVLVDWMNSVSSEKFKNILQKYFDYIHRNIDTLQTYLEKEKINPLDLSNIIMTAHIEDLYERQSYCYDNEIKDACLLAAVQEIIHYKISVYGTVAAYARALNMDEVTSGFREAEINEKKIDGSLCELAECDINVRAVAPVSLRSETEKLLVKNN